MEHKILPKLAFDLLKDSEIAYRSQGQFSDEILLNLHSVFGEAFDAATELLESYNFQIVEYKTESGLRSIFKISTHKEQYTIYKDINFCFCQVFQQQVLINRKQLTCKHILAVKLCRIMGKISVETVRDVRFVEFLNEQLNNLEQHNT